MALRPRTERDYMTLARLGAYLGYRSAHSDEAARKWVIRTGCPKKWRGKAWLVHPDDVDRILDGHQVEA